MDNPKKLMHPYESDMEGIASAIFAEVHSKNSDFKELDSFKEKEEILDESIWRYGYWGITNLRYTHPSDIKHELLPRAIKISENLLSKTTIRLTEAAKKCLVHEIMRRLWLIINNYYYKIGPPFVILKKNYISDISYIDQLMTTP